MVYLAPQNVTFLRDIRYWTVWSRTEDMVDLCREVPPCHN